MDKRKTISQSLKVAGYFTVCLSLLSMLSVHMPVQGWGYIAELFSTDNSVAYYKIALSEGSEVNFKLLFTTGLFLVAFSYYVRKFL